MIAHPPRQAQIPVIDLTPSFSAQLADRRAVAAQIRAAAQDTGFFYVANHRIPEATVDATFAATQRFFDQPAAAKHALAKQPGTRGYEDLGAQQLDADSPPDLKESYNIAIDHRLLAGGPPAADHLENRWPEALPGFQEALLAYYDPMIELGRRLMRLIALSLDEAETFFDEAFRYPSASLRLLRYPPHPAKARDSFGAGAHTDWGAITLLAQDLLGGLEVETTSGEWIAATPVADAFVVNLGDMIARWTNDRYHSNLHRVVNAAPANRHSLVLFFNPAADSLVECVPSCRPRDAAPTYPPILAGEHIKQRYLDSRKHTLS